MIVPLQKIAIIENASTDNVVRLSNINSGVDGASEFGYSISENDRPIRDNQPNLISNTHQLDIRTLEDDGSQEHLDNWTRDNTEIYIAGITLDGFFLWGDKETTTGAARLYKNYQFDGRRSNKIFARSDEKPGFDSGTGIYNGGVWAGDNGLGIHEWGDKDSSGVADGWGTDGDFTTTSFSSGQQTLETDIEAAFFKDVYFPFEGQQLTFSINIDSVSGSYNIQRIRIRARDASDSILTTADTDYSSTGRKSVSFTTPSNIVSVTAQVNIDPSSGTVTDVVSDPMLALGTGTTYTKY